MTLLQITITGLYNDEELSAFISEILSDMIPSAVIEMEEEINKEVNEKLKEAGNEFLIKHT